MMRIKSRTCTLATLGEDLMKGGCLSAQALLKAAFVFLSGALLVALIPIVAHANPGDLYATDNSSIRIYAPDGTGSIFASGLLRPRGLAFDGFGNLFVATLDTATLFDSQGQILKFAPDGTVTVLASRLHSPEGLALDGAGNLYFASGDFSHPATGVITK